MLARPPVQAGMLPSALAAISEPMGVRVLPSAAESVPLAWARPTVQARASTHNCIRITVLLRSLP
ncbi:hypothetical protein D3C78_1795550 [compost metagenome]